MIPEGAGRGDQETAPASAVYEKGRGQPHSSEWPRPDGHLPSVYSDGLSPLIHQRCQPCSSRAMHRRPPAVCNAIALANPRQLLGRLNQADIANFCGNLNKTTRLLLPTGRSAAMRRSPFYSTCTHSRHVPNAGVRTRITST
jgi:hypothetical protein